MVAAKPNLALRAWVAVTWAASPLLRLHLKKRVRNGKEDPDRWREKLGETRTARPHGTLVWLHAVGLGEVLALRGLVNEINAVRPDWQFLITSNTRVSAQVLLQNMPRNCRHQFLPLDTPQAAGRFLDHWKPDLAIWAEQELWPGLVWRTDVRGIPLALVNARMNAASFAKRKKAAALYADALARFALISAQDADTATHLTALAAAAVQVDGSLKLISPPLETVDGSVDPDQLGKRFVWVLASSHPHDEAIAIEAHKQLLGHQPDALLIIAPRDISRRKSIAHSAKAAGLQATLRSQSDVMSGPIYIADSFGELGLWYRVAQVACIGGTFDNTNGHNPWEAVQLKAHVIHGPWTANFASDYKALSDAGAATAVGGADAIVAALLAPNHGNQIAAATELLGQKSAQFDVLCAELVNLVEVFE